MSKPMFRTTAKEEAPVAAPPKSRNMLMLSTFLLLLIVAGAAGYYFVRVYTPIKGLVPADVRPASSNTEQDAGPEFVALGDDFMANLQHEEGDQYLQAGITLKIQQPELKDQIRAAMPEIRSKLLFLLSSKKPSELLTVEGKKKLIAEIIAETNAVLGVGAQTVPLLTEAGRTTSASAPAMAKAVTAIPHKNKGIVDVLFTSFIIKRQ